MLELPLKPCKSQVDPEMFLMVFMPCGLNLTEGRIASWIPLQASTIEQPHMDSCQVAAVVACYSEHEQFGHHTLCYHSQRYRRAGTVAQTNKLAHRRQIYIYIHMYTYTYVYIYIYTCNCVYITIRICMYAGR